ncbi:MAG: hypothetical protein QOG68_2309, partial [Solirubrobacteraceae bacterium]|nr:hypothetical protein [Solirubrobacteraceae bacterium]
MSTSVVMPRLSDSMVEGTVLRWLKEVGDEVAVGDELVEIETDKATMAYEADTAGTLLEILVPEGATVPLGAELARIGAATGGRPARAKASPLARRLADELGIDLASLTGSGP